MFEKSGDTKVLQHTLMKELMAVGDIATYETLSQAIGRDVRQNSWSNLRTARKSLEIESGIFTVSVPNQGIKRVDDTAAVRDICGGAVKSMSKKSRKTLGTLSRVSVSKLDRTDQLRHIGLSASCLAISHASRLSTIKKVEGKLSSQHADSGSLAVGKTLKMFADSSNDDGD